MFYACVVVVVTLLAAPFAIGFVIGLAESLFSKRRPHFNVVWPEETA